MSAGGWRLTVRWGFNRIGWEVVRSTGLIHGEDGKWWIEGWEMKSRKLPETVVWRGWVAGYLLCIFHC